MSALYTELSRQGLLLEYDPIQYHRLLLIRGLKRAEKAGDERTREWIRKQLVNDSRNGK